MVRNAALALFLLGLAACGSDATCQQACDRLYACYPDTALSTPIAQCVLKCQTDPGKGSAANRNCIADATCDQLFHGKCPDLIVR